ncbi:MAG: hypothetical protein DRG31_02420 [Deltaproteobacteria bacterium]|nr:MAG: hypothetical protein DRG31_02420 [Deltaproteobacteria bacterium]
MADLRVNFLGIEFKNPVLAASAEPTSSVENLKKVIESGVGGLVLKTITDSEAMRSLSSQTRWRFLDEEHRVCRGEIPRLFTLYGRTGLQEKGPREWMREIKELQPLARDEDCVMIGSIASTGIDGWVKLAQICEEAGLRIIELNFGCPHPSQMEGMKTGMLVGQDKDLAAEVVGAVTESVAVPVMVKLTPQVADVAEMARVVVEAGAAGVTLTNRFVGFLVDVDTGKPLLYGTAGVGGPWVKPLTLRWIYQVYRDLGIPISGSNGVYDARDVLEFMMTGATVVQMCSAVMAHGYKWFTKTIRDLEEMLDRRGYHSVREIIGIAARNALSYEEMSRIPKEKAVIIKDLCVDCGRCVESCFYGAMRYEDGEITIKEGNCKGCGICVCVCPKGAITLVQ